MAGPKSPLSCGLKDAGVDAYLSWQEDHAPVGDEAAEGPARRDPRVQAVVGAR